MTNIFLISNVVTKPLSFVLMKNDMFDCYELMQYKNDIGGLFRFSTRPEDDYLAGKIICQGYLLHVVRYR